MTDEADSSVVLAELQVALFRECNNQTVNAGVERSIPRFSGISDKTLIQGPVSI